MTDTDSTGPETEAGRLARRVTEIPTAVTLEMMARVRELTASGIDIVNLTIGEPDFDTPREIREAAVAALEAGQTKYSPIPGIPELREAICEKLRGENGLDYAPGEIVVTNGAKQAIVNTCLAFLEPGDEAIIPAPYWAAYPGTVEFCGARPVFVGSTPEDGFKLTAKKLEEALTPNSRLLFLNSPSNPSGAVYSRNELEAIAEVVLAHPRLWVLSDEIYERIVFTGAHVSMAAVRDVRERTVTINGVSKAFAMTGWRIGYAAAPAPIAAMLAKAQAMLTAGANPFAQAAAAHGLRHLAAATETMRAAYERRRDLVCGLLEEMPGVTLSRPDGAFYVFPDMGDLYGREAAGRKIMNSVDLCNYLLDEARVSAVPGAGFGNDRCIRISTAASEDNLREGMARIAAALAALK